MAHTWDSSCAYCQYGSPCDRYQPDSPSNGIIGMIIAEKSRTFSVTTV